jgi:hypothetical protein
VYEELLALARDLDDDELDLDPVSAVDCARLVNDPVESPLLNSNFPLEELVDRARHVRAGFAVRA